MPGRGTDCAWENSVIEMLCLRPRYVASSAALGIALTGSVLLGGWLEWWWLASAAFAATVGVGGAATVAVWRHGARPGRADAAAEAGTVPDARIAALTHDLRSPLNACLMWIDVLALQPSPEKSAEGLAAIRRNLEKQMRLLDALVDGSGPDAPDSARR